MDIISNPSMPVSQSIPGGLQPGKLVRVQGKLHPSPNSFSISLQAANSDIGLFLSPIFNPGPPRVARNSLHGGQWGAEEAQGPGMPLTPGQDYEVLILADPDHYKIALNGQHYAEYKHRIPLSSVSHLSIQGDTSIFNIKFEGGSAVPSAPTFGDTPFVRPAFPVPDSAPYVPPAGGAYVPPSSGGPTPYPPQPMGGGAYIPPSAGPGSYPPQPMGGAYIPPSSGPAPYPAQPGYGYPAPGAYVPPSAGYPGNYSQHSGGSSGGLLGKAAGLLGGAGIASALTGGGHKYPSSSNRSHYGGYGGAHGGGGLLDKAAGYLGAATLASAGKNLVKGKFKLF